MQAQGAPAVSTHGLWDETHPDGDEWGTLLIETLLILNETRVVEAVLRMAKNYKVDKVCKRWRSRDRKSHPRCTRTRAREPRKERTRDA